jgi:hypothetical protein
MAYTLANKVVQGVSTWAAGNNLIQKPTSLDEILLHSLHGANQHLADFLKFGGPSALGINMTGSLSHGDDIPNDPLGALVPQLDPIRDMAKAAYQVARQPNKANAKAAAYDLAPNSGKGLMENSMFTDKATGRFTNPHTGETQTIRSPADQAKRAFGFRPLEEAREGLVQYSAKDQSEAEGSVRQDIKERLLKNMDSNKGRVDPQDFRDYASKYLANNGDPRELVQAAVEHQGMGQARTAQQRAQGIPKGSLSSIFNYERAENLK